MLVVVAIGTLTVAGSLAGYNRAANESSGLLVAGWYNSLQQYEGGACLVPTGTNTSFALSTTATLWTTNLTASTGPKCAGLPQHWGSADIVYSGSTPKTGLLYLFNNTTGGGTFTQGPLGTYTYVMTAVPFLGLPSLGWSAKDVFFENSSSYSGVFTFKMFDCGCNGGGGGSGGGTVGDNQVLGTGNCPTGGTNPKTYVWDSVCFQKNYPVLYPHPDRNYYQIYTQYNDYVIGSQLIHQQIGTNFLAGIATPSAVAMGAIMGAILGYIITGGGAGLWATVFAMAIGAVAGAVLVYAGIIQFYDEANTVWFWVNTGLVTAARSIPWYVWLGGVTAVQIYLSVHVSEVRVGNTWYLNNNGVSGP